MLAFASVGSNLILVFMILWRRTYRALPVFSCVQFIGIAFTAAQLVLYWTPSVPDSTYHSFWVYTDQLFILLEAFAAGEIFAKCLGDHLEFCAVGCILLLHVTLKFHEWILRQSLKPYENLKLGREILNVVLTLLLAWCVYAFRDKENPMRPHKHSSPEDGKPCDPEPDPVDPPADPNKPVDDSDPGLPEHKPGH
jgi:hypothetical protein